MMTSCVPIVQHIPGMSDGRVYGIFDGTALANLQQMIFGTQTVSASAFSPTWAFEYGGQNTNTPSATADLFVTVQNTPGTCTDSLPFSPTITMEGSQCYAVYNPVNTSGNGTLGRAFGTTGIIW